MQILKIKNTVENSSKWFKHHRKIGMFEVELIITAGSFQFAGKKDNSWLLRLLISVICWEEMFYGKERRTTPNWCRKFSRDPRPKFQCCYPVLLLVFIYYFKLSETFSFVKKTLLSLHKAGGLSCRTKLSSRRTTPQNYQTWIGQLGNISLPPKNVE